MSPEIQEWSHKSRSRINNLYLLTRPIWGDLNQAMPVSRFDGLHMPTSPGPIIPVITPCADLIRHNLSNAGCNPGRSEFSTYRNCYIWFSCFWSFWTYMLELSTLIPDIIILGTWTNPDTTEDDCHGAAVITLEQLISKVTLQQQRTHASYTSLGTQSCRAVNTSYNLNLART